MSILSAQAMNNEKGKTEKQRYVELDVRVMLWFSISRSGIKTRNICGEFSVIWRAKRPQVLGTSTTFQVQRGSGPVYFPPRWTGYKNSWMKVVFKLILWNSVFVQILIYINNLHLLTFNPLLLACRSTLFPEMFYTKTPQIFIPLENHCMWWRVTWQIKFKLFTLACVFYLFQQERGIWAG